MLAADHVFEDGKQFAQLCAQAYAVADTGEIVTFGVTPTIPPPATVTSIRAGHGERTHALEPSASLAGMSFGRNRQICR